MTQHRDRSGSTRRAAACCALLCLSLLSVPGRAADVGPLPPGSSLRFRHLGLEQGLAQSTVQAVVQDAQGYMWLGTQDGLQRYDGYEFLTLRHDSANPASLGDNSVNALAVAPDGALWVGTSVAGLDRLEPGTRNFTHFQNDRGDTSSLASDQVNVLYQDRARRLWVGTAAGLDLFEGHGFRHYKVSSSVADAQYIYSLFQDKSGRLWVGTDRGLYFLDDSQQKLVPFMPATGIRTKEERGVFTESPIHALLEVNGMLWVASGRGIVVLDSQGNAGHFYTHDTDGLGGDHALAVLQDATGEVWVGSYGGGLSHLDTATGRFTSYQHDATDPGSLASNNLDVLYQDRSGLIWIGTGESGVDIYNPRTRAFGYYRHKQGDANSLASNMVWSMYKGRNGELWVATDSGLTRMSTDRRQYRQYHMLDGRPWNRSDDDQVNAVLGDRDGELWAATNYGLYRYQPSGDRFKRYDLVHGHDDPNGNFVSSLFSDSAGRLWAGTGAGLVQFDPRTGIARRFEHDPRRNDSLPDNTVVAICETRDKRLWLATANGLASFDGTHDSFTSYYNDPKDAGSLSYDNTQACHDDGAGGLWVGTAGGLDHLPAGNTRFRRYFTGDGLPNDTIYAILLDRAGGVWVSTDDGLSRLDPTSGGFRNYVKSDGLQSDEFNGGAAFAAADGELFFGGIDGMNAFHPERISRDDLPPPVSITRFVRQAVDVPLESPAGPVKQIEVLYRQNILSFEFTAFDYAEPELNSFSYRLDGFDTDWHMLRGRHAATYTNLDPGEYLLRVRGANSDGVWNPQETTLAISVLPPPWRTGWAYLLYVTVSFVSVMLGLGIYKRSIKREHDLEHEQQRRQWAEALHNLIHSVTAQRDERAIAEQLIDTLTNFISYERALFYIEHDGMLKLTASRGIGPSEQDYLEHWPQQQPRIVARLRQADKAHLLTPEDCATLAGAGVKPGRQHYMAVPLHSGSGAFRLLLVGHPSKSLDAQQMEVAAAMAKQVSVALDNAQLIKDLENLATTDGLTRLYNRRHFMERAEGEFERSRRYKRELSVFLIDADHFKSINDTHGHDVGDRALRMLAAACRQGLRHLDVLGRYGGEELVVLLPETSAALALETAERLRRNVEMLRIPALEGEVRLTISIGIATAGPTTESVAALINEADRALYEAKRSGRNRVAAAAERH